MFRTLANAFKIADLRKKMLFTLLIVLIYRIGANITVPFISKGYLGNALSGGGILGFQNILSGGAFEQSTLFALGVSPYITASIVIQLLTVAIPALERLAQQGEEGKKKMTQITRLVTIVISIITALGYFFMLKNWGAINRYQYFTTPEKVLLAVALVACFCAGSALVMWLAEKINEHGIGNGISIILFANIVSRVPSMFSEMRDMLKLFGWKQTPQKWGVGFAFCVFVVLFMLAMIWFIIFISDSERRIPVQYAKKVVGRKMYGGQNTNLPIKLNMTGVMPIIFASSIVGIPSMIAMFIPSGRVPIWLEKVVSFFSTVSWVYALILFVLIIAFAYFYVAISFNPIEVAGNLQKNGGSIPGIRPGKATSDFITRVLSRVTLIGAIALGLIAVVPQVLQLLTNIVTTHVQNGDYAAWFNINSLVFGGSSIIIVVGVILETIREIEGQMTMRHYKGFL